jgi:hypothetical protein
VKAAAICLTAAFGVAGVGALAQGLDNAMERLRACAQLAQAERRDCLEKLSRDIAPSPTLPSSIALGMPVTPRHWIVSETTSPIDYSPVAIATATSAAGPDGNALQLSIQCRGGRTDLLINATGLTRRAEDYVVSYSVNDGQPVVVAAGTPPSGTGVAVRSDVVRLLTSLPDQGTVAFRITGKQALFVDGRYDLPELKSVMDRLAGPCKWPAGGQRR